MSTDATRVARYNHWVGLHWLVTGDAVGGTCRYPQSNLLDRETALHPYTQGSAWFSSERTPLLVTSCSMQDRYHVSVEPPDRSIARTR